MLTPCTLSIVVLSGSLHPEPAYIFGYKTAVYPSKIRAYMEMSLVFFGYKIGFSLTKQFQRSRTVLKTDLDL